MKRHRAVRLSMHKLMHQGVRAGIQLGRHAIGEQFAAGKEQDAVGNLGTSFNCESDTIAANARTNCTMTKSQRGASTDAFASK